MGVHWAYIPAMRPSALVVLKLGCIFPAPLLLDPRDCDALLSSFSLADMLHSRRALLCAVFVCWSTVDSLHVLSQSVPVRLCHARVFAMASLGHWAQACNCILQHGLRWIKCRCFAAVT